MILLLDSNQFKVIFDKENTNKALAISVKQQEQLKQWQLALLFPDPEVEATPAEELILKVHPFVESKQSINGILALEINEQEELELKMSNLQWKPINDEGEEGDLKYQLINDEAE